MHTEKPKTKCINCAAEPSHKAGCCATCHPELSAMVAIQTRLPEKEWKPFGEAMANYRNIVDMQKNGSPIMSYVALIIRSSVPRGDDWMSQSDRIRRRVSNKLTKE